MSTPTADRKHLEDSITLVALQMSARALPLTRTKLVKLLYFVDLKAWDEIGHPVTGVEWEWNHYGPFSREIVTACAQMADNDELDVTLTSNYFGSKEYRITSKQPGYFDPPSDELERLIRLIVDEYGSIASNKIGDLSYETEPMRKLIAEGGVRGDTIEFVERVPSPRSVKATIDRYRGLLRESDEEFGDIADGLRDEAGRLDDARRSAGAKVLG